MTPIDILIRTKAETQGITLTDAQVKTLTVSVAKLSQQMVAQTVAAKQVQVGLVGVTNAAGRVSEAMSKATAATSKFLGVLTVFEASKDAIIEAFKAGSASIDALANKRDAGRQLEENLKRTASLLQTYREAGRITNAQASEYSGKLTETLHLWEEQRITVGEFAKRLGDVSKKVVELNPGPAHNWPIPTGSLEDTERFLIAQSEMGEVVINTNSALSERERALQRIGNLEARLGSVNKLSEQLLARQPSPQFIDQGGLLVAEEYLEWSKEYNATLESQKKLEFEIRELRATTTFSGQFTGGLQKLQDEYSNINRNLATASLNAIQLGVNGISESIMGAITRTQTWGQVFLGVGRQIIASLVQVGVQMVAQFALAKIQAAITGTSVMASMTPGALTAGAATFGANTAGIALVVAAIAAGIASMAFAEGGMVPGAPSHRDNRIAHVAAGEFIHRTRAVQYYGPAVMEAINQMRIPRDLLASMMLPAPRIGGARFADGGMVGGASLGADGAATTVNVAAPKVNVAIVNSRSELKAFLESAEGQTVVFDIANRRRTEMGIQT